MRRILFLFVYRQNQSIYHRCKRKPSVYGSRHLTYDIPFPIDECNTDDIEIRRRPSRRDRRSLYGKSLNKSLLRTHSLNLRASQKERAPVARNVSSPTSLQYGGNRHRWVICSPSTGSQSGTQNNTYLLLFRRGGGEQMPDCDAADVDGDDDQQR